MYLYGVCTDDLKHINVEGVIELLKMMDVYQECMDDCNDDVEYVLDWVDNYESGGQFGICALLYDVIQEKEECNIDLDDPNGIMFLGLAADAPWNFNETTRNMSEEDYNFMLKKYINMITDDKLEIRWWHEIDDCDW